MIMYGKGHDNLIISRTCEETSNKSTISITDALFSQHNSHAVKTVINYLIDHVSPTESISKNAVVTENCSTSVSALKTSNSDQFNPSSISKNNSLSLNVAEENEPVLKCDSINVSSLLPTTVTTNTVIDAKSFFSETNLTYSPEKCLNQKICESVRHSKLNIPYATMLPPKYKNSDVKEIFPDFRYDKPLRFQRLFGPGKPSNLPQIWRSVKRRNEMDKNKESNSVPAKRAKVSTGWILDISNSPPPADMIESDEEDKMMREKIQCHDFYRECSIKKSQTSNGAAWRHGPAKIWYDMLDIPEDAEKFDFGFKVNEKGIEDHIFVKDCYPDDAYLMVTQVQWENDVIWDGNEVKDQVLGKLYKGNNPAGWEPTGLHRTWSAYNREAKCKSQIVQPPLNMNNPQISKSDILKSIDSEHCDNNAPWWSILPLENDDLIYGNWEDDVIWDSQSMKKLPEPKILTLDLNDENIIFEIPDEPPLIANSTKENIKENRETSRKSRTLLGKTSVPDESETNQNQETRVKDDPFNISNDEYYNPKITEGNLLFGIGGNLIQHATPAVKLHSVLFPTHMGPFKRSHFHRPPLKRYSHGTLAQSGFHGVSSLSKHIRRKAELREKERQATGGGEFFFMRTMSDVTAKDGDLILSEYSEEHPPLLMQVGMATKVKNYYKRKPAKDSVEPEFKYGEIIYAHSSPFLGSLAAGQTIQTFENNLFRAPLYEHKLPDTDFLIIRTRDRYYIREVNTIFTVGQELPLFEVPCPKSKRAQNFLRDFIQVFIYRLFWKSRDNPRRIKMEDIKKAFPTHTETSIRRRLNLCADYKRTGGTESNWWVLKPDFRLPSEDEIQAMFSPEECCAYYSMLAAEHRLKDAGYGEKSLFTPENDDEDLQLKMDDEIKAAPWNTTRAFISAMNGKCLLQLSGVADPTGCGEGFSYVRIPNKSQLLKEECSSQISVKKIITGTDADLRKLSLSNAKQLLRKFKVPDSEIKKLSRWEIIDVVRTLSTEQAKAGEEAMSKFARGNRFSILELQEKYKEECQRLFDLQNSILSSREILSTDEDTSSEDDSDIEEMGRNLEDILSNKKTSTQLSEEKEEIERQELQKFIKGEDSVDGKTGNKSASTEDTKYADKILKICRTFRNADGKEFSRIETVRNQSVIEAYVKIRTTKSQEYIKQLGTFLDEREKEEIKRERRRIQDQLRRIKRNEEKENHFMPKKKPKKEKEVSLLKVRCSACGGIGHMKTNRNCPLYEPSSPVQPVQVEMVDDRDHKELSIEEDNLVKVDETKLVISKKLIEHAEEERRKSLVLKFKLPKGSKLRKRRSHHSEQDSFSDVSEKPMRTVNRRRTDPIVTFTTMLENTLNRIRNVPDSQPFWFPVNVKKFPDYKRIINCPMDLQTMRRKLQQKSYVTREDFLHDVNQILENSILYNGNHSIFTLTAQNMVDVCIEEFAKNEEKFMDLEKTINPLLDDNDQVQFSLFLETIVNQELKTIPESWPFHRPIAKKFLKDYQMVVKNPIDLETILSNIKAHKYQDRETFRSDVHLLLSNSIAYNGPDSQFTQKAKEIVHACDETLNRCNEQLTKLEQAVKQPLQISHSSEHANSAIPQDFTTCSESAGFSDSEKSNISKSVSESNDEETEFVNITGDEDSSDRNITQLQNNVETNHINTETIDENYDPSEFLLRGDYSFENNQSKEVNGDKQQGSILNLSDSDDNEGDFWF